MYEVIKEKFELCSIPNSYKRFDAIHPFDIYIGLNISGKKSLAIIANGKLENIESTKMINVSASQREDKKITITFDLLENEMSDLFYRFCSDIIESSKSLNKDIIQFVLKRWKNWIALFRNSITTILSEIEIKGLLGELIFLNTFMFKKYGYERSLNAWIGPELSHKDFEIDDTWYEIKTMNQNGITVKISSIEQLDSNYVGNLVILMLEPSNIEVNSNISLNSYIEKIKTVIPKNLIPTFDMKLMKAKYKYEKDYDKYIYSLKNTTYYKVDKNFPRITKEKLPIGIVKTNYELLLESIEPFKLESEM